jgi:hypothetical protein
MNMDVFTGTAFAPVRKFSGSMKVCLRILMSLPGLEMTGRDCENPVKLATMKVKKMRKRFIACEFAVNIVKYIGKYKMYFFDAGYFFH